MSTRDSVDSAGKVEKPKIVVGIPPASVKPVRADYVTADAVVALLVEHPEVMERPVLLVDGKAAIGRPIERIDALL